MLMEKDRAREHVARFGIDTGKPLITQVSRLDPWKDPLGVIDAYRIAKKSIPQLQLALVTQSATDDPEGKEYFLKVKDHIAGEHGIFVILNPPDNDTAVSAFQTASDIILQKSLREGFGLTVTEAMWKGAVVIGGNTGGIRKQIRDGVNGFLADSIEEAGKKIVYIITHPEIRERISKAAHEAVSRKYLVPAAAVAYFSLYREVLA